MPKCDFNKVAKQMKLLKTFQTVLYEYQKGLQMSMRSNEFNHIDGSYYKCSKISLNRRGSYIDSPDSIKNNNSDKIVITNVFNIR